MARIRSIHPGLWTDEDFVQMSAAARLFLIGLWNEADDYGLLEWRPTKLKMRLAPADNINASELMEEITAAGFLVQIERGGRSYGVIRNFRKWQRPQRPSAPMLGMDAELATLIALPSDDKHHPDASNSGPTPEPFHEPSASTHGKSFAMEDGGGKRKDEGDKKNGKADAFPVDASADSAGKAVPLGECERAVEAWNHLASEHGLPKVMSLTDDRRSKVRQRIREAGGLDPFIAIMARVRGSPHCLGDNDRGWRANFDFILQSSSFTKLREGFYDNLGGHQASDDPRHQQRAAFDAVAKRLADWDH